MMRFCTKALYTFLHLWPMAAFIAHEGKDAAQSIGNVAEALRISPSNEAQHFPPGRFALGHARIM
jgi:hypothetical protein